MNLSYCFDLHTTPRPEIGKVLVTGATGYIGGRLVGELLNRGYQVRIFVRRNSTELKSRWPRVEVFVGDAVDYESLERALKDVKIAYYLIHSILMKKSVFQNVEKKTAINFRKAAEKCKVSRIVYLGGLGNKKKKLSKHLKSRLRVADTLSKGKTPVTTLRAAMILGSGSASFEILKNLVKNLPFFLFPKWAKTKCQPISVRDVIKYLIGVIETDETANKTFDIGGASILTYLEMLKIFGGLLGHKKSYLVMPVSNYVFYGYVASFFTPVPARMIMALFEGAKNEVICLNDNIKKYLDIEPLTFQESVIFANDKEERDDIISRWSDAYMPEHLKFKKLNEIKIPKYINSYTYMSYKSAESLFNSIKKLGGDGGWFKHNRMWEVRGMIDKVILGVGTLRGRRSRTILRLDDVIDFWRIEDLQNNKRLLLRAEMKLPGNAWLEFKINKLGNENKLSITIFFNHKGLKGKIYWYFFVPFHYIIFKNLIKEIETRSE